MATRTPMMQRWLEGESFAVASFPFICRLSVFWVNDDSHWFMCACFCVTIRQTKKDQSHVSNMITLWEGGNAGRPSNALSIPHMRGHRSLISDQRGMRSGEEPAAVVPLPRMQQQQQPDRVVFRRSTSRVYSLRGNCAEERRAEQDMHCGLERLSVTRVLGDRSVAYTQDRSMSSGDVVGTQRNVVNMPDDQHHQFDREWMSVAEQFLPPYNKLLTAGPAAVHHNTESRRSLNSQSSFHPRRQQHPLFLQ
jgi:hypothetical protein